MNLVEAFRRLPLPQFLLLALLPASLAAAQPAPHALSAIDMLQPGMWQLRAEGEPVRDICVADPSAFLQLRHHAGACNRLVIANEPATATVQYSCARAGWGRTTVHAITPRSATIDTQGIDNGAPFAFTADAHRIGDCRNRSAGLAR